ncbi:hypothetical protein HID58_004092, partial [Brassica napus]
NLLVSDLTMSCYPQTAAFYHLPSLLADSSAPSPVEGNFASPSLELLPMILIVMPRNVGTVSMEWLAGEKTKVVGTFPPRKRGWTGYVEKDTAGQTNVYSIEPAVYIAESAISSGTAGSSSDGAENTAAIVGGLALIALASASSILLQVGKDAPARPKAVDYRGPSLSYYINKFKPTETVQASAPSLTAAPPVAQQETSLPETMASEAQPEEASSVPTTSST